MAEHTHNFNLLILSCGQPHRESHQRTTADDDERTTAALVETSSEEFFPGFSKQLEIRRLCHPTFSSSSQTRSRKTAQTVFLLFCRQTKVREGLQEISSWIESFNASCTCARSSRIMQWAGHNHSANADEALK